MISDNIQTNAHIWYSTFQNLQFLLRITKYKPVGDWISAPKPCCHGNKGRPHNILHGSIESTIPENPVWCKNLRSICHTSRLIGDFVQIWGSKFWALGGGPKSKIEEQRSVEWVMEN